MKMYTVTVHETVLSYYQLEARCEIDAMERWQDGTCIQISDERLEGIPVAAQAEESV